MNEPTRKTTVTLEDLLRVKRAEQPPAEFWTEFERGLRTKQLAAIVEPRPWWAPFIRVSARFARYQLPVGATAVIAITLFTIREYQPATPASVFEPITVETASVATPAPAGDRVAVMESEDMNAMSGPSVAVAASTRVSVPASAVTQARVEPATAAAASTLGAASHVSMVTNAEFSSARYIAEDLAAARATDPAFDPMMGRTLRPLESTPARNEPLAQISVPGESRRSRLLGGTAWLASATSGDSALRMNEQAARHLTERRLAESDVISRLDVAGNQVRIKF